MKNDLPIKLKLPDGFFDEEIRCGYTVSSDMKAVWAVELDLLYQFQKVCKKYKLTYFADGGTMLGAIRHNGFIPWDDDIDVMMMRSEYEKLCEIAPCEFESPYFFQTEYTDPSSLRGHAQLRNSLTTAILKEESDVSRFFNQGIFIDIFPIDSVPDNKVDFEKKVKQANFYLSKAKNLASFSDAYKPTINGGKFKHRLKELIHYLSRTVLKPFFNYDLFYRKYEEACKKYNDKNSLKVAKFFCIPVAKNQIWFREDFETIDEVPFEMISIDIPCGYHRILDIFFGTDWSIPKRIETVHSDVIFDPYKPYFYYLEEYK